MARKGRRTTLGDYFSLQRGTTYKSRLLGQPGPALLGLATIQRNGGFRSDSVQTYGGDNPAKLLVQPGELYVSLKDVTQSADLLGAVARLPLDHPPGRLTQDTVKLEPRERDVPIDYLYWLLRTPQYRNYCRAHATGTTNLGLAREDFLAFPAPEPTPIQRRLVDTFDVLEEKIELNRRVSETLEAMARALFKSWFVDFDPVRAKAEGRETLLPDAVADLFPCELQASEADLIPTGWTRTPLRSLVEPLSGGTPAKNDSSLWNGSVPWISPKAMNDIHADSADAFVTVLALGNGTRIAPEGSVLVMVRGMGLHTNVRVAQVRREVAFNQDVKALVPRHVHPTLLLFALLDAQEFLLSQVESSGHGTGVLPTDRLLAYHLTVPSLETQARLAVVFDSLNDRIANCRAEARTLDSVRDALLPELLSGANRTNLLP